jgi:DNA-binding MarR family transcriptional regulator
MNEFNRPIAHGSINAECCCFNMRKVSRAITQLYDRHLEKAGVRSTQFTLLIALDSTKAKTLTEIADSLVMDRTTLTRNLKPLEKLGFISTIQPLDKRSKGYVLTASGKEAVERAIPLWQDSQRAIFAAMEEGEYNSLIGRLNKLLKIISGIKK